jgi:hypothetical protein
MTYYELCLDIKRKADASPRILNFLLEHLVGKPVDQVQHSMETPTWIIMDSNKPKDNAEDAEVVDEEQFKLPEGK